LDNNILVVGLGNPGPRYAETRHNMGFMVLDELASRAGQSTWQQKFSGEMCRIRIGNKLCTLLKPLTFMNLSGRSVCRAVQFFQTPVDQIIVIHDELDVDYEVVRIKKGGGTAGHKGLTSLKQELGSTDFLRVRMGIGRPDRGSVSDYVLEKFSRDEAITFVDVIARGGDAVESILDKGVSAAMNVFNKRNANSEDS